MGRAAAAHLNTSRWSSMTTFTSVLSSTQNSRYTYRGRSYHSVFAACLGEEQSGGYHHHHHQRAFPGAQRCSAGPAGDERAPNTGSACAEPRDGQREPAGADRGWERTPAP